MRSRRKSCQQCSDFLSCKRRPRGGMQPDRAAFHPRGNCPKPSGNTFRSLDRMTPTLPLATLVKNREAELKETSRPFSHSRQSTCVDRSPPRRMVGLPPVELQPIRSKIMLARNIKTSCRNERYNPTRIRCSSPTACITLAQCGEIFASAKQKVLGSASTRNTTCSARPKTRPP